MVQTYLVSIAKTRVRLCFSESMLRRSLTISSFPSVANLSFLMKLVNLAFPSAVSFCTFLLHPDIS